MVYFLSSNYSSLIEERKEARRALDDLGNTCKSMENFVIGADSFEDIQDLIDESDILLLLFGSVYGQIDPKTGISWTEREYNYAFSKNKRICAIKLPAFTELEKRNNENPDSLDDSEKKQIEFFKRIEFIGDVNSECSLYRRICLYNQTQLTLERRRKKRQWEEKNKKYDLSGTWYSVHTSQRDRSYLRIGVVQLNQTFDENNYRDITAQAENYNVLKVNGIIQKDENGLIKADLSHITSWSADYEIYKEENKIIGVFIASRNFQDTFEDAIVHPKDNQKGIHEFNIGVGDDQPKILYGIFRNAASPNPGVDNSTSKAGTLNLYRDPKARDQYVIEYMNNFFGKEINDELQ